MKPTNTNGNRGNASLAWKACKALCRKIRVQIAGVKQAIFVESSRALTVPERLVQLALNEAEATAWRTDYPHLVFPVLATEKVRAVADWNTHQRVVRRDRPGITRAA